MTVNATVRIALAAFFCSQLFHCRLDCQEAPPGFLWYSVDDGLAQSTITCIHQDKFGFLWIGTGYGVNRYDGKSIIKVMATDPLSWEINQIPIRGFAEDEKGNLWIGSRKGPYKYDRARGSLTKVHLPEEKANGLAAIPVHADTTAVTWVIQGLGLTRYSLDGQFRLQEPLAATPSKLGVIGEAGGLKWIPLYGGKLLGFSINTGTYEFFDIPLKNTGHNILCIERLSGGEFIIGTEEGFFILNTDTKTALPPPPESPLHAFSDQCINCCEKDNNGRLWISTNNGALYELDKEMFVIRKYHEDAVALKNSFSFMHIREMYTDRSGNIWLGTDGSGIGKISQASQKFLHFHRQNDRPGQPASNFFRCFYKESDDILWAGTFNSGLNRINLTTENTSVALISEKETPSPANDVFFITGLTPDLLLIGSFYGLYTFSKNEKTFCPVEMPGPEATINKASRYLKKQDGSVLALINQTVFELKKKNKGWHCEISENFRDETVNNFFEDSRGNLWVDGNGIHMNRPSGEIYPFSRHQDEHNSLKINCFHEDKRGIVWSATSRGLVRFDTVPEITAFYGTAEGFADQFLYGILEDREGRFWISSNRGLSLFDPSTEKVINFGPEDGVQSFEFNSGAFFSDKNGWMFFGGVNGFNYFHPDSVRFNPHSPMPVIVSMDVFNEPYPSDSNIIVKKSIGLGPGQNTITLEFASLELTQPWKNSFSYFLAGYDKEWSKPSIITSVRYTHLPPGSYTFMVRAANNDGIWNENPAVLHIRIEKPLWRKTWFMALASAIVISLFAAVFYFISTIRIRRQLAELERQNEINLLRRKISSDLHDELGSGLSKIIVIAENAKLKPAGGAEATRLLGRLSATARELVEQLSVIVWTLNTGDDRLDSLIAYIHRHTGDFLENCEAGHSVSLPEEIPPWKVSPAFKRNVYYAVKEAVNNAVRHSGAKQIDVAIQITGEQLSITVSDNGKGLETGTGAKHGNGLNIMKSRIEELEGAFSLESRAGYGTRISFSIPLKNTT